MPARSNYSYCVLADSDGKGNRAKVGFLHSTEDPLALPRACPHSPPRKTELIAAFGRRPMNSMVVTQIGACTASSGGPGAFAAAYMQCPAGAWYTWCLDVANDGNGNHLKLGVVEREVNDMFGMYGGTRFSPTSQNGYRMKIDLLDSGNTLPVKPAPWNAVGVRTISEEYFSGAGDVHTYVCPAGGIPYDRCYEAYNDGAGNHVLLGVFDLHHRVDDLYGRCRNATDPLRSYRAEILKAGFTATGVIDAALWNCQAVASPQTAGTITQIGCPAGFGSWTYCFSDANDGAGNAIVMGVRMSDADSGDVNADGVVDCADYYLVRASKGRTVGQAGFDGRAERSPGALYRG